MRYTWVQNVWLGSKSVVTFGLIKKTLNCFHFEKKIKMADSKKVHFSKSPILKFFSRKFLRLVLGLVGLNDAKGIDVAQRIWL